LSTSYLVTNFLPKEAYQYIAKKLEVKHNELIKEEGKKSCSHLIQEDLFFCCNCNQCEKENKEWVGLRLCITCGHVGCDDSSKGMHAAKHFVKTEHAVIVALPDNPWKWCYIHRLYG
jgi:uncharacterized UBP type Zn finger protein